MKQALKPLCALALLFLLAGCWPAKKEPLAVADEAVEVGAALAVTRFNDAGVVAKTAVEYQPESDVIRNLGDLEPGQGVRQLFDRPFKNLDARLSGEGAEPASGVEGALAAFHVALSDAQLRKVLASGWFESTKLDAGGVSLCLYRASEAVFRVSAIEIHKSTEDFQSNLALDSTPRDVLTRLGEPNFKTADGSVFIYHSFTTLRQLNIVWHEGKILKVQYIAWQGL